MPGAPAGASAAGAAVRPAGPARVAVVGAGASGVLTAIHLLASRAHDLHVTLHESRPEVGTGPAYGTTDPRHLLNVRSRHMSAFPDIPGDLVEWAARTGRQPDAQAFLPRRDYAAYLAETLAAMADHRLRRSHGRVHDVIAGADGWTLLSDDATSPVTHADAVVLAPGNAAPAPLQVAGRVLGPAPWHLGDPWDLERLLALPDDAVVVLVGTGLTAVDTAVTLLDDAPARRVVMVSRHGLLPHAHVEQSSTAWVTPVPPSGGPVTADGLAAMLTAQVAAARRQGVDWRPVVDGLRAPTQALWQGLPIDERRRFLAVWARRWEVLRHRMAPEVAARLEGYREQGRLRVVAGGLEAVREVGAGCEVGLAGAPVRADAVVNCTGPMTDLARTADPLLRALVDRGVLAPDPLRLGAACTADGVVLDEAGREVPGLYVVGPPRKGTLWESTAVPEIRGQAAALAAVLPQRVRTAG